MTDKNATELKNKIRQQFDFGPYPRFLIDESPKDRPNLLYIHNLATPYYLRNQKVIESEGKLILDAGCGTGYKALALAFANPGAKIIGIDLSERSIELARERFKYQNCQQGEFHVLGIDDLPNLELEFDYINCDELLYLFPDPSQALQAMKSVLKPQGIIRSNLHSSLQRFSYFRAQSAFKLMGLMNDNPEEMEIDIAVEIIKSLKNGVDLKKTTWSSKYEDDDTRKEETLMNYLFQGDKGFTIPDLFAALQVAGLEFIDMVNWRQWDLMELFENPEDLPVFLALSLPEATIEEKLHLFELLHPAHRLLDFWCGHPGQSQAFLPIEQWTDEDWKAAKVNLHPQLKTSEVKQELSNCCQNLTLLDVGKLLPIDGGKVVSLDVTLAACLLPPLFEGSQSIEFLVERWLKFRPIDLETLEETSWEEVFNKFKSTLTGLEAHGYVFLENQSSIV
ncbi:class I SAM-dependent methyltransferase [Lusitaniella coriacea LEGE 07157]|uniref:Class I SAM-dependent methyltransferase n=1 Tax=Lusitaniella coriacea LEGE 07157 TaxID=945747 RepID=A0A8J7DYD5_9CYAN|nr:class I SAM-dependent methyltransferase [Lusitaniella coriacea]MBE9117518.1 class I SAM-dependent methyltransferase [Lusitaniella coriacea LEGE 07157]